MEELKKIILKIKELEDCGELRLVYSESFGSNAIVMANCDKFVIVMNPTLSYEQQMREIWHEAKHICCHLNNWNYNVALAEYEAEQFVNKIISKPELFSELKAVTSF